MQASVAFIFFRHTSLWKGRSPASLFLQHLPAVFFFGLITNQNTWLEGLNPIPSVPRTRQLILGNSVLECTCLIVYQLNWRKKKAGSGSLRHSRLILEICKLHFLCWLVFLVFVVLVIFLWLIPAEWGRFLVRLRAGAILRPGLLPI